MVVVAGVFLAARGRRSPAVKSVDFPAGEGPRTEVLVSPQWVHAAQVYQEGGFRGEPPARWGANRLVVVEAAWVPPGKRAAYDRGHVPGAVLLNTEDLETGYPAWQLRPLADLQLAIGRVGITPETTVVVYARSLLAAARVWWVLSYAGVKDVRLMNGGWDGWQQAGFPIETIERPVAAVDFAAEPRARWLMTTDEMRKRVGHSDLRLGDVRSVEEFAGRASGYSTLDARGRIPGAIHLGDADDASPLYRSRDGRLRSPQDVLSLWQRQGLDVLGSRKSAHRRSRFLLRRGMAVQSGLFLRLASGRGNAAELFRRMGGMEHHLPPGSAGRRIDPRLEAIRDRSSSGRVAPSHNRPLTHSLNKTAARQRKHPPEIHSGQPPKMAQPSAKGPQLKPPVHR